VLDLLPNEHQYQDHDHWIGVLFDIRDAGADWPNETRTLALAWCAKFPNPNPEEDRKRYDDVAKNQTQNPRGFERLLERARIELVKTGDKTKLEAVVQLAAETAFDAIADDDPAVLNLATGAKRTPAQRPSRDAASRVRQHIGALKTEGAQFLHDKHGNGIVVFEGVGYELANGCQFLLGQLNARGVALSRSDTAEFQHAAKLECLGGAETVVFYRVATDEAKARIVLDLAQPGNTKAVEVTTGGWRTIDLRTDARDMVFIRDGATALPDPLHGGKGSFFDQFLRHVALPPPPKAPKPGDPATQVWAAVAALLCGRFRGGEAPHGFFGGPERSGKTATTRKIRDLFAPSAHADVDLTRGGIEALYAAGRRAPFFNGDNISARERGEDSGLSPAISDALCRMFDGTPRTSRKLYSDTEANTLQAQSSGLFTSIDGIPLRADLRSRSVAITAQPPAIAQDHEDLRRKWQAEHPSVLGAFLDGVASALANEAASQAAAATLGRDAPRYKRAAALADAFCAAQGWPVGCALDALVEAQQDAARVAAENDPLVVALSRTTMDKTGGKAGTVFLSATRWGEDMRSVSPDRGVQRDTFSGQRISDFFRRVQTTARATLGLEIDYVPKGKGARANGWRVTVRDVAQLRELLGQGATNAPLPECF
jgi:hypothetical protein